ncbi:hypothetical protein TL16_g11944 [Triparma laevis f. inornata]|uniref:Sarcosine dehydrogenase n=1 Tax=Triparma laevis f. inornata TaxID=1714386 RepID=A0A9W7BM65_9STRA|nr:hypothetical protein TL16_g11944 [Triparma laevis f. inornata]
MLRPALLSSLPSRLSHRLSSPLAAALLSTSTARLTVVPSEADVVVIGGGIIGTSTAYHLKKLNPTLDVVLLEQNKLTSGTTWHAAGLMVTFGSLSHTSTEWRKYTKELYETILEEETGMSTGFKPCGFIELASTHSRVHEMQRISSFNRFCGIDVHEITPLECQSHFPLLNTETIISGYYVPTDGRVNPYDACMAYAKGFKNMGGLVCEKTEVEDFEVVDNKVVGIKIKGGEKVKAKKVVNCTGMWSKQVMEKVGGISPNQAAEHYYLITEKMDAVDPDWPVIEDPEKHVYVRPEGGGLMLGLFEPIGTGWSLEGVSAESEFLELPPDWERMTPYLETAMSLIPATLEVGVKNFFCGPESFTPDNGPMLGESNVDNLFVASGLNSIGILSAGGVGRTMAHWIDKGYPDCDVTAVNANRFQPFQTTPKYREERVRETIGMTYLPHFPNKGYSTAIGIKKSPIHERLKYQTTAWRDVSGWAGAMYYADYEPEYGWGKENYHDTWKEEHEAVRNSCGLIDMSFMSKYLVQGKDAGAFLDNISTAKVDGPNDTITYCQWLDERGMMHADLTVTKMKDNEFMVVATDTQHQHTLQHMQKRIGEKNVVVTDVTGGYGYLNLQGPKSRELLQSLTSTDLSDNNFHFRTSKIIDIGYTMARCTRITYCGELGYEIYPTSEFAIDVYDTIMGSANPPKLVGLKALGSLRLEKGYRDYGHDVDNTDTVVESGLGFTCEMGRGFIGEEKVKEERTKNKGGKFTKRMVNLFSPAEECWLHHGELVLRDGVIMGEVRAGSHGFTLGGAVGLAMLESPEEGVFLNKKFLTSGKWEVQVGNEIYPLEVQLSPLYDPKNEKIKG